MAAIQQLQDSYRQLEAQRSSLIDSRRALGAQLAENEAVKAELAKLGPNNQVFKMTGPVLLKQDTAEAKANVDTRLQFISNEITKVETRLKTVAEQAEAKKMEARRRLIAPLTRQLIKISTEQAAKRQGQEAS